MTINSEPTPVWAGHIFMQTGKVAESSDFMQMIGMRLISSGDEYAVLEMRGGTHLVISLDADSNPDKAGFDLMVDDLDASHANFQELGYEVSEIERGQIHDCFEVREPGGNLILFNSSHVGKLPV